MSDHWATLRAGLLALFVAGLIWIWAEGESLTSRTIPRVQIELPRDLAGEFVIRPDEPGWTGIVQVRLEGPVRAIDSAAAVINSMAAAGGGGIRMPVSIDTLPKSADESTKINLSKAFAALPELANLRGVVADVQPPELKVRVIQMVTRELPVRVELARELPLDGDPAPTPAVAQVRLAASAAALLGDQARVHAVISDDNLVRLRNDGPQTFSAPLRLAPELMVEASVEPDLVVITPASVTVSLRLKQTVDSVRLPNVPVWFSLPPTEDGAKWNVEVLDKFLTDVSITGPGEEIKRIKSGALAIKAMVELTTDDLEKSAADKAGLVKQAVFIGAPASVTCAAANTAVRVRAAKRTADTNSAP